MLLHMQGFGMLRKSRHLLALWSATCVMVAQPTLCVIVVCFSDKNVLSTGICRGLSCV